METAALLFLAAIGAGAVNAVAGGGGLLTFPLLMTVAPPVTADATSAVALLPGYATSTWACRKQLAPVRRWFWLLLGPSLLGGLVGALLALGVLSLLVVAMNPYSVLFLLPSLHAWIWLPQLRHRPGALRAGVLVAGFGGPLLLIGSLALRLDLGFDAPWYLAELAAVGFVPFPALLVTSAWLAVAGQLSASVAGRYAPYPAAGERPRLGVGRRLVRRAVLASRGRSRADERKRALGP